ncbi:MAG TPA: UDP-N-acetylmuramoyl-tripeptide--D-alanyl-D-alanine ligase [Anaerohalosphaeraceae bacterium]|nr:UDP-N-acetylmuramoyl-tripeptide--D-alanyl-D-alanine ligase [Anaerohalosphaeraceae bacterium]HRT49026.1 UDP-N-acetylmuramoyl-tripeptide--D-alanyl-D-alanine ligase [Anaerohalosphaeraceae bacterium]HRT85149.1 UDP-N-acetylmuramoyl-tripeptide--D-alanyl-D-alanine ligase [Anaerohalosphaeraceae bacterium]
MKAIEIRQLAEVLRGRLAAACGQELPAGCITGVSTDSREVEAGDCFVAIRGPRFDGHAFVEQAVAAGARCVIADKEAACAAPVLVVDDSIAALGDLARWYRGQVGARVIAITGSAGKTTTRRIVCQALRRRYACHESPKSFNNNIGVPLTILSTEAEDEFLVMELGSNAPGEIGYLTRIARPDIAVVTNVYPAHLEGFGTLENIVREKASIGEGLADGGTLLINGDCDALRRYCDALGAAHTTFGRSAGCDVTGSDFVCHGARGSLRIEGRLIETPLAGQANLENVLAAWALCRCAGLSLEDFAAAAATLEPAAMRLNIQEVGPVTLINDCYNANPVSMANAIDTLVRIAGGGGRRTVFVCGQMGELGADSERYHVELGRRVAEAGIGVLAAAGPFAEVTAEAARQAANGGLECLAFGDTAALCDNLMDIVRGGDIILVKGSRSAGLERAVKVLMEAFS